MKLDDFSYVGNVEIEAIGKLYKQYLSDPDSVDESWRSFFKGFDFARKSFKEDYPAETFEKEFKVINLIDAYRKRGHLFTKTNPVRTRRKYLSRINISKRIRYFPHNFITFRVQNY